MGSIKTTINQTMSIDGEDTGYFGVSKTKKGIKLPDKTFTYGRPNHCIDGGAQEAMQYLVLQEKREIQKAQERSKKVVKLNRIAVKSGLVTSSEQKHAMEMLAKKATKNKKSNLNKNKNYYNNSCSDTRMNICDMPPAGIQKARSCQEEIDEGAAAAAYKKQRQAEEREKMKKKKIYETQAKLIRNINDKALLKEEQRSNPKQPWQMSKFKSVKSTLNTFRSEGLKKQSFKQHEDNRCIRLGQTGHGNYKQIC